MEETIFSPGRVKAGEPPADPPGVLAFVEAFPAETSAFEPRGVVDACTF